MEDNRDGGLHVRTLRQLRTMTDPANTEARAALLAEMAGLTRNAPRWSARVAGSGQHLRRAGPLLRAIQRGARSPGDESRSATSIRSSTLDGRSSCTGTA
jgi:hypothetical protein